MQVTYSTDSFKNLSEIILLEHKGNNFELQCEELEGTETDFIIVGGRNFGFLMFEEQVKQMIQRYFILVEGLLNLLVIPGFFVPFF